MWLIIRSLGFRISFDCFKFSLDNFDFILQVCDCRHHFLFGFIERLCLARVRNHLFSVFLHGHFAVLVLIVDIDSVLIDSFKLVCVFNGRLEEVIKLLPFG
jgi:hypothetical protein